MNTSKRPADAGEWRRQRAWHLQQQGRWQKDIAAALARGAEAYGFGGDVWTAKRIADVIWPPSAFATTPIM